MASSSQTEHQTTLPSVSRRKTIAQVLGAGSAGLLTRLGLAGDSSARGKHHRKKKRCRKLGATCIVGGTRTCCGERTCSTVGGDGDPQTFCCLEFNSQCQQDSDCCAPSVCDGTQKICVALESDRAAKANFGSVAPADMLERVRALPITTWNYRRDEASIRHIGPMAQDFTAAFGVGSDDRMIHPMDGQGVALAAIQGLATQIEALQAEQQRLMEQIATLEARC